MEINWERGKNMGGREGRILEGEGGEPPNSDREEELGEPEDNEAEAQEVVSTTAEEGNGGDVENQFTRQNWTIKGSWRSRRSWGRGCWPSTPSSKSSPSLRGRFGR